MTYQYSPDIDGLDWTRGVAARRVEFAWSLPPDWDDALQDPAFEIEDFAEPMLQEARRTGFDAHVESVGVGRGFSADGVVLVIETALNTVGNVIDYLGDALVVREIYRELRKRRDRSGRKVSPPMISAGTAKALALAHLYDHRGNIDDVEELSVTVLNPFEPDHTGVDIFLVVFGSTKATWTYLLEATGGLLGFSEGPPIAAEMAPYWTATPYEAFPRAVPTIISEEEE